MPVERELVATSRSNFASPFTSANCTDPRFDGGEGFLRLKGAVAIAQTHAHRGRICGDGEIGLAVSVHITQSY